MVRDKEHEGSGTIDQRDLQKTGDKQDNSQETSQIRQGVAIAQGPADPMIKPFREPVIIRGESCFFPQ